MIQDSRTLTVVIPNWNGLGMLRRCLGALAVQTLDDFEVTVVDNGSTDGSAEYLTEHHPEVRLVRFPENRGFAAACNAGIGRSGALYVALLNNDTQAEPGWAAALVNTIGEAPPEVACLASKMVQMHHPELIDDAGDFMTRRGCAFKRGHGRPIAEFTECEEVPFPCAGAALYRRSVFEKVGSFDELFFTYLEDVDLGVRLRMAGYRCWFVPTAVVHHTGHGSGMPTPQYVFLTARNRLFLLYKNLPWHRLLRFGPALAYGWLFYFLAHSGSPMYLRGTLAFFKHLSAMHRRRKTVVALRRATDRDVDALFAPDWPEITLGALIRLRLKHAGRRTP